MAFKIQGKITGLEDVLKSLKELPAKLRKKHLRKAVDKGGKVLLDSAKQKAPVETGLLRKSLGKKVKVYPSGVAVCVIGPRKGFKREVIQTAKGVALFSAKKHADEDGERSFRDPRFYAHLVELGFTHPGGKQVPARSFLRSSFVEKKAEVRARMIEVIKAGIAAEAGKK